MRQRGQPEQMLPRGSSAAIHHVQARDGFVDNAPHTTGMTIE
jgi:hypothetical protein